jgi:hypothetical protein
MKSRPSRFCLSATPERHFFFSRRRHTGRDQPAFLTRVRSEVVEMGVDTRRATEGPGGVVNTTLRSPTERPTPVRITLPGVPRTREEGHNAVDMPVSAAVVEGW